jgi:ketosteroid isomerase-like protein
MSRENVEIVRRAYEAFNRGDPEAGIADMSPTFEYAPTGALPDMPPVARGPDGYAEFARWLWDQFDDARTEIHELTDAHDKVVASVTLRGRGRQSGVEVGWHVWHVWTLRDGKVIHGRGFTSRPEALEAAGLSE